MGSRGENLRRSGAVLIRRSHFDLLAAALRPCSLPSQASSYILLLPLLSTRLFWRLLGLTSQTATWFPGGRPPCCPYLGSRHSHLAVALGSRWRVGQEVEAESWSALTLQSHVTRGDSIIERFITLLLQIHTITLSSQAHTTRQL
jgi:hypothetical protein